MVKDKIKLASQRFANYETIPTIRQWTEAILMISKSMLIAFIVLKKGNLLEETPVYLEGTAHKCHGSGQQASQQEQLP